MTVVKKFNVASCNPLDFARPMTTGTAASGSPLQSRGQRHKGSPKARIRKGKRDNSFSPTMQRCLFVLHVCRWQLLPTAFRSRSTPGSSAARAPATARRAACAHTASRAAGGSTVRSWRTGATRSADSASRTPRRLISRRLAPSAGARARTASTTVLTFVPCGARASFSALRMRNVSGVARRNCTIGWVRSRSGASSRATANSSGASRRAWMRTAPRTGTNDVPQESVGSEERVPAFLDDLLSLRWYLRTGST